MDDNVGDRVGQQLGDYRLISLLGQGNFADVYLAEHVYLKTLVAIKVLAARLIRDDVEKFGIEARTIARLVHPHIVRVSDFGIHANTPYLVMEYAPNGSLRQRHPKGSQVPLATIVSYVHQVAEALEYAHQQKLIHRDVKPENMLIGRANEVLLSDFGISTVVQSSSDRDVQQVVGSVEYMAPEQLQGRPRFASDQYALGIVIYEWLCGQCPFSGLFPEIATQHLITPPSSLRLHEPSIPSVVEEVVFIALAKDPKQRFSSMKALANALEQASKSHRYTRAIVKGRGLSRRTVAIGIAASAVTIGGIAWLLQSHVSGVHPSKAAPSATALPLGTTLLTYRGHYSMVQSLAWSPNGKLIASGGADNLVLVWDATSGGSGLTYKGHSGAVMAVVWSPDGKQIVSSSEDGTVQVWNASTGDKNLTFQAFANAVAWSSNSKRIVAGNGSSVQVWDATSGASVLSYQGHETNQRELVYGVAWSPKGMYIASTSGVPVATDGGTPSDQMAQVWNAITAEPIYTYPGHSDAVFGVAWSPNGQRISTGSLDKTAQVWDALTGEHALVYNGHSDIVYAVPWSPNGKLIASSSGDGTVQLWSPISGNHVYTYHGHSSGVYTAAWSPDGNYIASGSGDKTVQVWTANTYLA